MRIFQAVESSTNSAVPGNQTWRRNLYEPLVEMGHEVFFFSVTEGLLAMQRNDQHGCARFSQKLLDTFCREHAKKPFDLFFAYIKDGMVVPAVIDEINKTGVPSCNFSCNNAHQFFVVEKISPHFTFNLHSEKNAREKFLAIGANPIWWPMASNPKYFKPYKLNRTVQVSFVGANMGLRAKYIAHLLEKAIEVHVYGPGWQSGASTHLRSNLKRYFFLAKTLIALSSADQFRTSAILAEHDLKRSMGKRFPNSIHDSLPDDELIFLYSRSQISLGVLEMYDNHDPSRMITRHLHLREFEAPICGALYCTGYSGELAEMFEPDKEVITYRNEDELLDKVRYYLCHSDEAEKIREAGLKRALRDHTYHQRYKTLFHQIGLHNK